MDPKIGTCRSLQQIGTQGKETILLELSVYERLRINQTWLGTLGINWKQRCQASGNEGWYDFLSQCLLLKEKAAWKWSVDLIWGPFSSWCQKFSESKSLGQDWPYLSHLCVLSLFSSLWTVMIIMTATYLLGSFYTPSTMIKGFTFIWSSSWLSVISVRLRVGV